MTRLLTRRRLLSAAGLFAASGLLHFVALRSIPAPTYRNARVNGEAASIDFEVGTPGALRTPEPPDSRPEQDRPPPPTQRRAAQLEQRAARRPAAMPEAAAETDDRAVESPAPEVAMQADSESIEPAESGDMPHPSPAPALDLDPRRAVRGTLIDSELAAARSAERGSLAASRGAELSAALETLGNDNPRRHHRTPALVHNADGSCSYDGDAIRATILADGGVRFEDKPLDMSLGMMQPLGAPDSHDSAGREPPGLASTPEDTKLAEQRPLALQGAGRAWAAERSWFLRETDSMRAELADAAHARELAGAEHALRKELDRIWCATAVPAADRRRELFSLWDNTSGDEVGARGRRTIEQYLRENLPLGSPLSFPEADLAELNAHRTQREAFDPYGAARDDRPGDRR